jgi:phenylalanyl-tRNA synthetase beta chain
MRLPLLWLHDHCDPGLPAPALAERLAMTGTEVDRIHAHGVGARDRFVVARVVSAERHPDADRLSVCVVDLGGERTQIVCGAPNVAAGQTVAVARPGAVMPDGVRLERATLRGVESDGMILAEDEVAIGTDHDGIMVLPEELEPGTPSTGSRARSTPRRGPRSARGRGATIPARPARCPACRSRCRTPTCARASPRGCSRT